MTDREEFEKFLKDNFLYDTSGFIQNEAERKKAQDESFVWRAWQARGELDAVRIKELEGIIAMQLGGFAYHYECTQSPYVNQRYQPQQYVQQPEIRRPTEADKVGWSKND